MRAVIHRLVRKPARWSGGAPPAGRQSGAVTVMTALAIVPVVMAGAIAVDTGRVWVERQQVQTAAEAALAAAASIWADSKSPCSAQALDIAVQNAGSDAEVSCTTTGDSAGGQITVTVERQVDTTFTDLLGRSETDVSATATAVLGGASSILEVRPMALCVEHPALVAWRDSGFAPSGPVAVFWEGDWDDDDGDGDDDGDDGDDGDDDDDGDAGGDGGTAGGTAGGNCAGDVPGNWGVLDFDGGSDTDSDTRAWIEDGYQLPVSVPATFEGVSGVPSPSVGLDPVVGETVVLPLFGSAGGDGDDATFSIVSFAAVTIHSAQLSGPASGRHIVVSFDEQATNGPCCSPAPLHNGLTAWRICSVDDHGSCP